MAGTAQRPRSYPEQNPIRGIAARESRAPETTASRRLQGPGLSLQTHPGGLLRARFQEAPLLCGSSTAGPERLEVSSADTRGRYLRWGTRERPRRLEPRAIDKKPAVTGICW